MKVFGIWSKKINEEKFQQAITLLKRNPNEEINIISLNENCIFGYVFHSNEEFLLDQQSNKIKFIYPDQFANEYLLNCKYNIDSQFKDKILNCSPLTVVLTQNEIKIMSDFFGLKKLFYTKINEEFIFASEMKPIIHYSRKNLTVNKKGLVEFFLYNFFWGETTYFNEISNMQPKQSVTFNVETNELQSVYFDKYPSLKKYKEEREIPKLVDIFVNGLKKYTQNGETVIWLSGGLDSRLILTALKRNKLKINHIINFGYKTNKDNKYAQRVIKSLELDDKLFHYEINADMIAERALKHLWINEGFSGILNSHLSFGLDEVKKKSNANLIVYDGYAGDVIFGGSYGDSYPEMETKLQNKGNKTLIPFLKGDFKEQVENYDFESFKNVLKNNYDPREKEIRRREFMFFDDYLRKKIASGGPKIGADYGVIITPYFYKDFFNTCMEIPIEHRNNRAIQKKVIEHLYPDIAELPSTSLIFVKKGLARKIELFFYYFRRFLEKTFRIKLHKTQSYVDADKWLRKSSAYYEMISSILFDEITEKRGFYNLQLLKKMLDDHMKRKNDYGTIFSKLFDFEITLRLFLDEDSYLRNQLKKDLTIN